MISIRIKANDTLRGRRKAEYHVEVKFLMDTGEIISEHRKVVFDNRGRHKCATPDLDASPAIICDFFEKWVRLLEESLPHTTGDALTLIEKETGYNDIGARHTRL